MPMSTWFAKTSHMQGGGVYINPYQIPEPRTLQLPNYLNESYIMAAKLHHKSFKSW